MPAAGGEAKRLTFHSARRRPQQLHAPTTSAVLFSAGPPGRWPPTPSSRWALCPELYSVPVAGGEAALVLTQPAIAATVDPAGTKILYHDQKGYESDWRKHHTSSVTRDIWVYDLKAKTNTAAHDVHGRGPQPGLRRQRRRFLLPERAATGRSTSIKSSLSQSGDGATAADPLQPRTRSAS
ncbi:MAG: hypothetical protein MZU91_11135 [Desulfosudis oleivorans]|nr:hypothetical protein [Desulfosudis oleivorans]